MRELTSDDPVTIGPYRLTGRLGEGGMGRVYLGESRGGRRVAVKVVRPEVAADPGFRSRFRREVEAAKTVGGFWTAPVVDADPDATVPWVASDYLPAPDLATLVSERGPLDESAVLALARGLAEALEAIHRAGLVHRDLKPSNVLVTGDGPRVIDFGISKALEGATALTGTGSVIGTPGFMSPEQASGGTVGAASDIFSLGAVLAFAATGREPFGGGSAPALLYRVVHDSPRLEGVPPRLVHALARCLDKAPERRPTAGELLDLLVGDGQRTSTVRIRAQDSIPPTTPSTPAYSPTAPVSSSGQQPPASTTDPDRAPGASVEVDCGRHRRGWKRGVLGVAGVLAGFVFPSGLVFVAVGGVLLLWGLVLLTRPFHSRVLASAQGLEYRFRKSVWSGTWQQLDQKVTLEPMFRGDTRTWRLTAVVPRTTKVPFRFNRLVGGQRCAAQVLRFRTDTDARLELTRLDAALRRHAPASYRRDPALEDLLAR